MGFCSLGCSQARCSPIFNGKMCSSHSLEECCLAQCTFKQLGKISATYDIQEIIHSALGIPSTCSEESLAALPKHGYSRKEVVANPVGNTCPVKGTCDLYQCENVIGNHDSHVYINEDYVAKMTRSQSLAVSTSSPSLAVSTSSPSLAVSFSTEPSEAELTSTTNPPVQSSPSTKQTSTNLPTSSLSDTRSAYLATASHNKIGSTAPSKMPPTDEQTLEVIVAGVSAAVLLCTLIIILIVMCLTLLFIRGELYYTTMNYFLHTPIAKQVIAVLVTM